MRSLVLIASLFLLPCCGDAAPGKYFDFSVLAQDAYQKAVSLRFSEAREALDGLRQAEPDNLMPILVENYIDFLTVFANDNGKDYRRLSKNMEPRLYKISKGDPRSPYYLYCQAEIRLQWAFLHSRFGDFLAAMSDTKQAYALLTENQRRFPDFIANKKSLGIMHALVGNVPEEYRWTLKALGGMGGTTEQGLQELEAVREYAQKQPFAFEDEALVAQAFLLAYLNNQPENGWRILEASQLKPQTNPMAAYAMAMVAMRAGHNETAIRLLQQAPHGDAYYPFYQRDYLLGLAKLRRLDKEAGQHLTHFVDHFKGENGLKEGYQKLAWFHLIFDNVAAYQTYANLAKTKGATHTEPDKAAFREAKSGEQPEKRLLQARLLFDGGYYQRASDLIHSLRQTYAHNPKQQLEFTYRMGRISHKLGKTQEAVRYYQQTIDEGARRPWYFACNAALQLGLLQEEKKAYQDARNAYLRCIDLKPEAYAGGLHAQAKAGLGRIKGK